MKLSHFPSHSDVFFFSDQFSGLYVVSLMVIMVGFITFNAVPTPSQTPDPVSEERGHDNQAAVLNDERQVSSEAENQNKGMIYFIRKGLPAENGHGCVLSSVQM